MKIPLNITSTEYEMNHPNGRAMLRRDLMANGFFEYEENKPLWPIFDQPRAEGTQAMKVLHAVKLFDCVKTGRYIKA